MLILTSTDVIILYDIVRTAESQPTIESKPFRAIFAAYETILPEWNIDHAHDSLYLRFLFKLGQSRRQGETLFESFERLLRELDIQIVFNEEEHAPEDGGESEPLDSVAEKFNPRKRTRRASYDAIYDAQDETTRTFHNKGQPRWISQGLPSDQEERPADWAQGKNLIKAPQGVADPASVSRSGLNVQKKATAGHLNEIISEIPREQIFAESGPIRRHLLTIQNPPAKQGTKQPSSPLLDDQISDSDGYGNDTKSSPLPRILSAQLPPEARFIQPSRTQLFRDADAFYDFRIRAVAKDVVDRWCEAALKNQSHQEHMRRLAVAYDTEVLLRQAFEHWRARLHARKKATETERFFARLAKRAARARDLYLLTKAFTHWVHCADDERRQRIFARQQVLGIKYFHAWRDITIEHQGKVKEHLVKTYFGVWKQCYIDNLSRAHHAQEIYQRCRLKEGYWQWFWSFCESPKWYDRKMKQKFLLRWWDRKRFNEQQTQASRRERHAISKVKALSAWSIKVQATLSFQSQAMIVRKKSLLSSALASWSGGLRFAPLRRGLANLVDWRIAGSTFQLLVHRFQCEKQAQRLAYMRRLRIHWTLWNDNLRCQALRGRLEDRYALEALYKWVVAERFLLLQRLIKKRVQQRCFAKWRLDAQQHRHQRSQLLPSLQQKFDNILMRIVLSTYAQKLRHQQERMSIAHRIRGPHLQRKVLECWRNSLQTVSTIGNRMEDPELYHLFFVGKHFLRHWQLLAEELRRRKRRDAYAIIRRRAKMRIVSTAFHSWRERPAQIGEHVDLANQANQQRLLILGTTIFDSWKNKLMALDLNDFEAQERYRSNLYTRLFRICNDAIRQKQEMAETAFADTVLRTEKVAFTCLRKLSLRILEQRSQQGKAEGLKVKHKKRHELSFIRVWREQTAVKLDKPFPPASMLSNRFRRLRSVEGDEHFRATARAEGWTELDTHDVFPLEGPPDTSTPMPSYLSTPSKRAARARALFQTTTPLGTPFQSRLQAQLNITPRSSRASAFSRSVNATGGSILEESPPISNVTKNEDA